MVWLLYIVAKANKSLREIILITGEKVLVKLIPACCEKMHARNCALYIANELLEFNLR